MNGWKQEILEAIGRAVGDKSISKQELAEGLDEIASMAEDWSQQMYTELNEEGLRAG